VRSPVRRGVGGALTALVLACVCIRADGAAARAALRAWRPAPLLAAQLAPDRRRPDVHFVPSPDSAVLAMLNMAQVTSHDVVYDLGSGDGRIPIVAAKQFGARGVGIEIDGRLVMRAEELRKASGVADRVVFLHQDLFEADLREATVVTLFLLQGINLRLMPKLQRELKPGSRVVSLNFTMGDRWPPDLSQDVNGLTVHMWTVK
jgi:SAM-dependent methyltransferase